MKHYYILPFLMFISCESNAASDAGPIDVGGDGYIDVIAEVSYNDYEGMCSENSGKRCLSLAQSMGLGLNYRVTPTFSVASVFTKVLESEFQHTNDIITSYISMAIPLTDKLRFSSDVGVGIHRYSWRGESNFFVDRYFGGEVSYQLVSDFTIGVKYKSYSGSKVNINRVNVTKPSMSQYSIVVYYYL